MRRLLITLLAITAPVAALSLGAQAQQPFTLQQILSAPYASELTAAPIGNRFAWVENAQGVRNIWVAGPTEPAKQITTYTRDDGQEIADLAWSPDGNAVAYTYGNKDGVDGHPANPAHLPHGTKRQVIIQRLSGKRSTCGDGHSPFYLNAGPHKGDLVYLRTGNIWLSHITPDTTHTVRELTFDRGSASQMTLSPDGARLAFVSTRDEGKPSQHSYIGLYLIAANKLGFIAPSTGVDTAPIFSPDGRHIAFLRAPFTKVPEFAPNRTSPNPWQLMVTDITTTNVAHSIFTPEANKPGSVLPHMATGEPKLYWLPDNRIAFASEADGWVHLYSIDSTNPAAKPILLTPGKGEVEDVTLGKDGQLLWASNIPACLDGTQSNKNLILPQMTAKPCDPSDTDRRHIWHLTPTGAAPSMWSHNIEVHPVVSGDGTVAVLQSNLLSPMHPMYFGKPATLVALQAHTPASFPSAQLEHLKPQPLLFPDNPTPSGRTRSHYHPYDTRATLHGQLFLPHTEQPGRHAAIIFVHGGPNRQMLLGYPAMEYYSNAYAFNQYLASRGFIVLSVNYHLGIGYGTTFRQIEHAGPNGAAEYADVLAAARYLRTRSDVDPARIGIWGGSYGGYLTALALARNSNLFAAGVDVSGVHDWNLEDNASDWLWGSNAEKDAIAARARASSPIADVAHWRSPVLFIDGDDDPDVAYAQTPTLAEALKAHHVPVEELIFPDEVHDLLLHSSWLAEYEAAAAFFEKILKPQQVK